MKNLGIASRLAISIVFLLIALTIIIHAYIGTISDHIERARLEKKGLEYLQPLTLALKGVGEYNALLLRKNAGDISVDNRLTTAAHDADLAFSALLDQQEHLSTALHLSENELKIRNLGN